MTVELSPGELFANPDRLMLDHRMILDSVPAALFIKDRLSRIVLMNRTCEEHWGVNFDVVRGTDGSGHFPPDQMAQFLATDAEVFKGGVPVELDEPFWNAKLGRNRIGHTIKRPIYDYSGQPYCLVCITIDITENREAGERLSASEEKLRNLYQLSPLGIALTDMEGKYLEFNPAFQRICGYTPEELNELDYWALTPPEYAAREHEQLESLLQTGRYGPFEKEYLRKDGQRIPLRLNGVLVHGPGGVARIWSIVEDISAERSTRAEVERQRVRLDEIIRSTNVGTWEWNVQSGDIQLNDRWAEIIGYRLGELQPVSEDTWRRLCHPDDLARVKATREEVFQGERAFFECEMRMRHKDGHWVWVLSCGSVVERAAEGTPLRMSGTHLDITERIERAEELRRQKEELELAGIVFHTAREGIVITDSDSRIVAANEAVTQITGYTRDEIIGRNPIFGADPQDAQFAAMWESLKLRGHWEGEVWNRDKAGGSFAELLKISAVRDEQGRSKNYVALFSDITRQKQHQQELERSAYFDPLTGLPNRVLLADRLRQAILTAKREKGISACLYLDLDGFKAINDTLGHEVGDRLLVALAERMRAALRQSDTLARVGGDEFVGIIIDLENMAAGEILLRRLLDAARKPVTIDGAEVKVSASIGVTFFPQTVEADGDLLLRQADQAMYQSKLRGRNCFTIFDDANDRTIREAHESLARLRLALENGEFLLFYQPKVDLRKGIIIGAEALIRWRHPERGLLLPEVFLPAVRSHPFAAELGDWVIETALLQIAEWRAEGMGLSVSVNVDLRQLERVDFPERLRAILSRHPTVQPGDLHLEILETSGIDDEQRVVGIINNCRAQGVSFSLDDFGTGYSSLSHLRRLAVDQVKIDQSFIHGMLENPGDLAIVGGIIALAAVFDLQVIAEGVENGESQKWLLRMGCSCMQGYFLSPPLAPEEFRQWRAAWIADEGVGTIPVLTGSSAEAIYALADHRTWVRSVERFAHGDGPAPVLKQVRCRFGEWLAGPAKAVLAGDPRYDRLLGDYERAGSLVDDLIAARGRHDKDTVDAALTALHTVSRRITADIEAFLDNLA